MERLHYLQTDVLAKRDITRNSKVISFKHVRDSLESAQVFSDLLYLLIKMKIDIIGLPF